MSEYKCPDEYLQAVQNHIEWKRAKSVATSELADHIQDQYFAFLESGYDNQQSMEKAIAEMGDAELVGKELNRIHQPKINWAIVLLTGLFLLAGIITSIATTPLADIIPKFAGIAIGCIAAGIVCFLDYTLILRFPRIIYCTLLLLTILSFLFDARNGISLINYSYTFYLLMIFPLAIIGVAFHIKSNPSTSGLIVFILYAVPPIFLSVLISSQSALLVLSLSVVSIIIYIVKQKWARIDKNNIIGVACILLVLGIGIHYVQMITNSSNVLSIRQDNFTYMFLTDMIKTAPFAGNSSISLNTASLSILKDRPIALLIMNYGVISVILLSILFAVLLFLVFRIGKRQNTDVGRLISHIIVLIISLQLLCAILTDIGVFNAFSMCLPFVTSGGIFTIYNLLLIGVLLSVNRNEDIAKDWIRLKDKVAHSYE